MSREMINKLAEVATAVGWQANEPAVEMAGHLVSFLYANPEHIDRFMEEGSELFVDGTFSFEAGSLTYRALNGQILSPKQLRESQGKSQ